MTVPNTTVKKKTVVKKKKRKLTPLMKLFCYALIAGSVFLLYSAGTELYSTLKLRSELSEVQQKLQEIQDENLLLNEEKQKLQDPNYVQNYVRGKYMISKSDEQIFYLPENDKK